MIQHFACIPKMIRYKHLIGKTAILPIVGRKLNIIADDYIDLSFGTGVMKVTPAHDTNDFLLGQRHELEQLNIFDETGRLNAAAPKQYEGMDRFECRKQLVKDLEAQGFLVKIEPYVHNIGKCYRCHTIIEPWLSDQWFVKMKPLAAPALRVVHEGKIQFPSGSLDKGIRTLDDEYPRLVHIAADLVGTPDTGVLYTRRQLYSGAQ